MPRPSLCGRGRLHSGPLRGYDVTMRTATGIVAAAWLVGMLLVPTGASAAKAKTPPGPATRPVAKAEKPDDVAKILAGGVPRDVADLEGMEKRFREVAAKVTPATVGVAGRGGGGSGVIVTKDGYVLTVGHITREAGRDVTVILPDGRRAKAKTLGANLGVDSGLVKIVEEPKDESGWPHCEMGSSDSLKQGQWVLAAGHPGGFRRGRTPPVRIGRVLRNTPTVLVTDCAIVSGDSGGPLYDMAGKVIGISSRISGSLDGNIHVPVDTFRRDWDRLVKGETFGSRGGGGAYLGVQVDTESDTARIVAVVPGLAAAKAGVKAGDVIRRFDGKATPDRETLLRLIAARRPGHKVSIVVLRGEKELKLEAVLGKRPG
jgi:serine protease Do